MKSGGRAIPSLEGLFFQEMAVEINSCNYGLSVHFKRHHFSSLFLFHIFVLIFSYSILLVEMMDFKRLVKVMYSFS